MAEKAVINVPEQADRTLLKTEVAGYDFNRGINYSELLKSFLTSGFQATNFGLAVEQIEQMVTKLFQFYFRKQKLKPFFQKLKERSEPFEADDFEEDLFIQRRTGCTIFLGYTSNMISSGIRDTIRFLVQHNMVNILNLKPSKNLLKSLFPRWTSS